MKKVLVYVGYKTINYGSMLQAFATLEMLKKLGVEPVMLNLDGLWEKIKTKKVKFYLLSGDLRFLLQSKGRMYCSKIYEKLNCVYGKKIRSRRIKFDDFIQTRFALTDEVTDFFEASVMSEKYDMVLLGSDQVWLPSSVVTDIYTLNFVKNEQTIKIAYAPSFGIGKIPMKYFYKYKEMLNNISHISVREETGKKIVEEIAGIDCPIVADPVLMLDKNEWEASVPRKKNDGLEYIFVYLIGNNRWQREWIKKYAIKKNMKTVALIHLDAHISYDDTYFDYVLVDESPLDFLNWIRNAKLVFTDSYHCVLFSLIEHREFWCFKRFDDSTQVSTNSRLYSILKRVSLENRLLINGNDEFMVEYNEINYDDIDERINIFRDESYKFLRESME